MAATLRAVQGAGNSWVGTLRNGGVPLAYGGSEPLDAAVWRGGGESPLFAPAVAWSTPAAGQFSLSVSAAQTAAVDPGEYRIQVGVTASGVRAIGFDGLLLITDGPGDVPAPIAWCSGADMLLYSDAILSLQASRAADSTGFLGQRFQATEKRSRRIVTRYAPGPGFVLVRQNRMDPILGLMDVPSPTAVPPSKAQLTDALAIVGGVVLEEKLREIVARDAIALVLRRQATGGNARNYIEEAVSQSEMADDLFRCYQAQVVAASPIGAGVPVIVDGQTLTDGFTRFLIDQRCVILPGGTAP